jgi:hypothetical protein
MRALLLIGLACASVVVSALAAPLSAQTPAAFVDSAGVFRWTDSKQEIALFGVNYASPFAYDYRAIGRLGLDRKAVIDADVAHLARLGVDAFRIHVWDREVSDTLGNLLANEHLDLFDYLLSKLEQRGIKVILTPIAWWGSGYPEPDPAEPGFSAKFPKNMMGRDARALPPQLRYVQQFVAHENPYTKKRYSADPNVIAFELFNEPHHDGMTGAAMTAYINALVGAARAGGAVQPIFYNITEHFTPVQGTAVCAANIQGVSGQWYPTGLLRGEALPINPLPNVDRYVVPFDNEPGCKTKARMIYEFDAADVMRPVMYPAMARSFRQAGFQWATQFAYDPLPMAPSNTEYQTHFLNVAYTPAKAVSFLIAGEVFRRTPRGFDAGVYPASARFGTFTLDATAGRSEMVTDSLFAYSASTTTAPRNAKLLQRVAGVGNSPVVRYGGSGAYFLDKLAPGVWRFEVYPDAEPVIDPFTLGQLDRAVTRIVHRAQPLRVALPDLGGAYRVTPLHAGNSAKSTLASATLTVRPGVYLLSAPGVSSAAWEASRVVNGRALGEYYAPAPTADSLVAKARATRSANIAADSVREAAARTNAASRGALFDAARDYAHVVNPGYMEGVRYSSTLVPASARESAAWRMQIDDFGNTASHVAFRTVAPAGAVTTATTLVIRARTTTRADVEVALVQRDGTAWGLPLVVDDEWQDIAIPLSRLQRVPLVLLPRPYPTFQAYAMMASSTATTVNLSELEGVQIGIPRPGASVTIEVSRVSVR